jgi:hypothetical protein
MNRIPLFSSLPGHVSDLGAEHGNACDKCAAKVASPSSFDCVTRRRTGD